MTKVQVMFQGMMPAPTLEEAAHRVAEDFATGGQAWTSCHVTFQKPAGFATGDELWLHLDLLAPGRHISITRTRPAGQDPKLESAEELVRQAFLGAKRTLGTSPSAARWPGNDSVPATLASLAA